MERQTPTREAAPPQAERSGRVFVTRAIPDVGLELLRSSGLTIDVWEESLPPPREALIARAAGCDALLTLLSDQIDGALLDAVGPQLRVVSNFAVGYNNIDLAATSERGIAVGNTPDVLTEATADLAFALLISAARRVGEGLAEVREHRWQTWEPLGLLGQSLSQRTLGIFGMGRIGAALARRCVGGWGMKVLYCARARKPAIEAELRGAARHVDLPTLLRCADFLSLHAPLTAETRGLFGREAFAAMKPGAVFVNTARGALHDEAALAAALRSGQLFAAGLDVTEPEPLPERSPLRALPNCLILPHIGSATREARREMSRRAAENIIAGLRGELLPYLVKG